MFSVDVDHLELDSFAVEAFGARRAGYRTIFTPYAELYHYEFTSRGREEANEEKLRRWKREQALFMQRWGSSTLRSSSSCHIENVCLVSIR